MLIFQRKPKHSFVELIWDKMFSIFKEILGSSSSAYHLDLHAYSFQSFPFLIVDRLFYNSSNEAEINQLHQKTIAMVDSMEMTWLMDFPPSEVRSRCVEH